MLGAGSGPGGRSGPDGVGAARWSTAASSAACARGVASRIRPGGSSVTFAEKFQARGVYWCGGCWKTSINSRSVRSGLECLRGSHGLKLLKNDVRALFLAGSSVTGKVPFREVNCIHS